MIYARQGCGGQEVAQGWNMFEIKLTQWRWAVKDQEGLRIMSRLWLEQLGGEISI